jgi:hypothetical protein
MNVSLGFNLVLADANLKRFGSDVLARGKDFESAMIVQIRGGGLTRERPCRRDASQQGDKC